MAVNANGTLTGIDPAATACKAPQPMQPSGLMVGPSTTGDYIRPIQQQFLPTGYDQTARQGACGYGYYNPNGGFQNTAGIMGYCQGGQHKGFEVGQALHCGTPMPYMYQPHGPVFAGQQAANQCQYNQQIAQMYQQTQNNPHCAAAYRDLVKQENAGYKSDPSQGITAMPYTQLGGTQYWAGQPGSPCQASHCMAGMQNARHQQALADAKISHAGCGEFTGFSTSGVNGSGFDAGGVPLSIPALYSYLTPAAVAQNTTCNWNNVLHSGCPGQVGASAQWLGLEGETRGLCLLAALVNELPGGLCVSYQGSGGSNSPGGNYFSYPWGCTVTYSHEMQEMLNPNCRTGNQDNSDVRYNSPGTPAHCNNFKSCGVGWQCFDSAFTAYWGTNYCTAPDAWQYAKTPQYAGGLLLGPGGGAPLPCQPGGPGNPGPGGPPGPPGPGQPIIIIPGVNAPIPQAPAAKGCSDVLTSRRKSQKPELPVECLSNGKGKWQGGMIYCGAQRFAMGGNVMHDPTSAPNWWNQPMVGAAPAGPPGPPGPPGNPGPQGPPIIINPNPPPAPPPVIPCIQPYISASPAYPYRGVTCEKKTNFPGFETWNFPLGSPEVPGGPPIPTPPPCASGGHGGPPICIPQQCIPITNIPGVTAIRVLPCGNIEYIGTDGNPVTGPTGNPTPVPTPCVPCVPAPVPSPTPAPPPCNGFGKVSPFMPCYMGDSPWPSPQNAFGGCLPMTPWLPGGKVDNGLGPSPSMPSSPTYGLQANACAQFHGPQIPGPVMPFGSPSSTTTSTHTNYNHPTFCQWDQHSEDPNMLANNWSVGGNAPWSYLAQLQAGQIAFPTVTCVKHNPGVAPVTPGQCGNLYAYPGSDKWTGTNPNPYIYADTPAPGGPGPEPCGGDGDDDDDDDGWGGHHMHTPNTQHPLNPGAFPNTQHPTNPGAGQPDPFNICGAHWTGGACFGGTQWGNQGQWGGWGNPWTGNPNPQGPEDSAEAWAQQHWGCLWNNDIAHHPGGGTTTTTTQGGIPCWHPPDWNSPTNPGYGNTSNPTAPGGMPTWPGQANTGTGKTGVDVGGYSAQATPFLNGDLYKPGFETVGAGFQGNPWQPSCLGNVNPGAISMGLAGMQIPAPTPAPTPGGTGGQHHARGGRIVPGNPEVAGDSEKNDKVKALLSPGEIVIPRSVALDADAPRKAAAFVAAVRARKSPAEALRRAHG